MTRTNAHTLRGNPSRRNSDAVAIMRQDHVRVVSLHAARVRSAILPTSVLGHDCGFALMALLGSIAVLAIVAGVLAPNFITTQEIDLQQAEDEMLQTLAEGAAMHLRARHRWPAALADLGTGVAPVGTPNLRENDRRYPRYFALHPHMRAFDNDVGLAEAELVNARFLLVSNRAASANVSISTPAEFDTWWRRDDHADKNLHIYRHSAAESFVKVTLVAASAGGSFQIGMRHVDSLGGTLAQYERYHLRGTKIRLDEAAAFSMPEVEVVLSGDVTYEYDADCQPGERWHTPGHTCGGAPALLWVNTWGSVSGQSGADAWNQNMVVAFDEPGLAYTSGPSGRTDGTFRGPLVDLHPMGAQYVEALHFVSRDMTIGTGGNTVALHTGDVLASNVILSTMASINSMNVEDNDVYVFRPAKAGDYTSGMFFRLFDGSDVGWSRVSGMSLVERDTTVGDVVVPAGSFLMRVATRPGIVLFVPSAAGINTAGTLSTLYEADDYFYAFDLVEEPRRVGDVVLSEGQILATVTGDTYLVGDNHLPVGNEDVFALSLSGTGKASAATAELLFDGSEAGLSHTSGTDAIVGVSLSADCEHWVLPMINPGFETGTLTGWALVEDRLSNGGVNRWGVVTDFPPITAAASGTAFAAADALGQTGEKMHQTGLRQRVDIRNCRNLVDNGDAVLLLHGKGFGHMEDSDVDTAHVDVTFYDAVTGGTATGASTFSNHVAAAAWTDLTVPYAIVPPGTQSIEITAMAEKNEEGTRLDAGIDGLGGVLLARSHVSNRVMNPGFEERLPYSGWTYAGVFGAVFDATSSVVLERASDYGITPPEGTWQAKIRTTSSAPWSHAFFKDTGYLESFFGFNREQLHNDTDIVPTQFVGAKQPVLVGEGMQVTFQWNFMTTETPGGSYNDLAFFSVTDELGSTVAFVTLASAKDSPLVPHNATYITGYQSHSFAFPAAGTYTIYLGVVEDQDTVNTSGLYFDDFRILPQ